MYNSAKLASKQLETKSNHKPKLQNTLGKKIPNPVRLPNQPQTNPNTSPTKKHPNIQLTQNKPKTKTIKTNPNIRSITKRQSQKNTIQNPTSTKVTKCLTPNRQITQPTQKRKQAGANTNLENSKVAKLAPTN